MILKKKSYFIILKCKKATNYGSQIVKKKTKKTLTKNLHNIFRKKITTKYKPYKQRGFTIISLNNRYKTTIIYQ